MARIAATSSLPRGSKSTTFDARGAHTFRVDGIPCVITVTATPARASPMKSSASGRTLVSESRCGDAEDAHRCRRSGAGRVAPRSHWPASTKQVACRSVADNVAGPRREPSMPRPCGSKPRPVSSATSSAGRCHRRACTSGNIGQQQRTARQHAPAAAERRELVALDVDRGLGGGGAGVRGRQQPVQAHKRSGGEPGRRARRAASEARLRNVNCGWVGKRRRRGRFRHRILDRWGYTPLGRTLRGNGSAGSPAFLPSGVDVRRQRRGRRAIPSHGSPALLQAAPARHAASSPAARHPRPRPRTAAWPPARPAWPAPHTAPPPSVRTCSAPRPPKRARRAPPCATTS